MIFPFFRRRDPLTYHNLEKLLMTVITDLQAAATALIASNDQVLAKLTATEAQLATVNAQLSALQGDQTQLQAIIDSLNAETAKNAAI